MYQTGIYPSDSGVPLEIMILDAAGGDPLRAQEISERLTPEWWAWWVVNKKAMNSGRRS